MYCKVHESEYGMLVAACDDSVQGKTLKDKDIEFFVNPRFYGEKKISEKKLAKLLAHCYSANLVGKKVVGLAQELTLVNKKNIVMIKKIPHAQAFVVLE